MLCDSQQISIAKSETPHSRYIVGWMLAPNESASLAEKLLADTIDKQRVNRNQLTIHADNGSSMASKPVAFLLADLGVTKTHSRPHVSNDNPYSEAHFKTLKYRPQFPERFGSIEDARSFLVRILHLVQPRPPPPGIGMHTPANVHHGNAASIREQRATVLTQAYTAHPERFVRHHPVPHTPCPPPPGSTNPQTTRTQRTRKTTDPTRLTSSVVSVLCFDGCEVVAVFVGSAVVEPVNPFGGGDLEVVEALPGPSRFDQLGLVEPDHRLSQGIVVGLTG